MRTAAGAGRVLSGARLPNVRPGPCPATPVALGKEIRRKWHIHLFRLCTVLKWNNSTRYIMKSAPTSINHHPFKEEVWGGGCLSCHKQVCQEKTNVYFEMDVLKLKINSMLGFPNTSIIWWTGGWVCLFFSSQPFLPFFDSLKYRFTEAKTLQSTVSFSNIPHSEVFWGKK